VFGFPKTHLFRLEFVTLNVPPALAEPHGPSGLLTIVYENKIQLTCCAFGATKEPMPSVNFKENSSHTALKRPRGVRSGSKSITVFNCVHILHRTLKGRLIFSWHNLGGSKEVLQ
jgi:hypothetical protein